jgi:hypothetical protein
MNSSINKFVITLNHTIHQSKSNYVELANETKTAITLNSYFNHKILEKKPHQILHLSQIPVKESHFTNLEKP